MTVVVRPFERKFRLVLALALIGAGCDIAVSTAQQGGVWREDKHFQVTGQPRLELQTFDGSIEVRTGAASDVLVTIERRAATEDVAKALEVTTEQSGDRITVRAQQPARSFGWGRSRSVSLVVTVPATAEIEARSGDGSIRIQGVAGGLKSHTGDGSIKLTNVSGDIDVSSGDGSIAVDGRITRLHARSGDGSVAIRAASGSTTSDEWNVTTGDGSITIELPAEFSAELDAHTGDGGIHVQDLTVSNVTGEMGRSTLRGRLGNGGGALRVRTGDGSITLRRF